MNTFDPVKYTIEENKFLLDNLGKPSIIALKEIPWVRLVDPHPKDRFPFKSDIIPASVKPILDRVYELEEIKTHTGVGWVGVEALKDKIRVYLSEYEKGVRNKALRSGAPRFPSMYNFDAKGRAFLGGPGSDCGQVKTYFDAKGNRIPFAVELVPSGIAEWRPEWAQADEPSSGLKVNTEASRIECLVCGHTESFKPESRASYNAARARTSKHLKSATDNVDAHRETAQMEFS